MGIVVFRLKSHKDFFETVKSFKAMWRAQVQPVLRLSERKSDSLETRLPAKVQMSANCSAGGCVMWPAVQ